MNRVPYRVSLRVLGRLLNGDKARMATMCEIDQGFLLHYFQRGEPHNVASRAIHSAEVLDLDDALYKQRGQSEPSDSIRGLQSIFGFRQSEALRFQKSHPLCPMGYEEFLRAVGDALDRRSARAVQVSELEDRVYVEYTVDRADFVIRDGQRMALPGRRQESYTAAQIVDLVRRCREHAADLVQRSGQHLSFNPMDVTSYLAAAPILEEHGQHREAEDLYRRALELAPNHPEAHYRLASHARRRGDRKAALKHVERAILHDNGDGRFYHLLGRLNTERNNPTEAARVLERAIACEPDNRIYHFHLAQVYERLGRIDEARAILSYHETYETPALIGVLWPEEQAPAAIAPSDETPTAGIVPMVEAPTTSYAAPPAQSEAFGPVVEQQEALARPPELFSPFAMPAPAWDTTPAVAAEQPALPPAERTVAAPVETFADGQSADGLPVLGIALAREWDAPQQFDGASSTLDVPADSAEVAATLPLSGVDLSAPASLAPERGGWTLPSAAPVSEPAQGTTTTIEPNAEEAVQLAAAIMRAQEHVQLEPNRADLHRKLGFLLAKQGRSEEAATEFRRAVECGRRRMAS